MVSSASRSSSACPIIGDARDGENADEKPKPAVPSFRRLLLLNAPEWKFALVGSSCAVLSGAIQPIFAYGMGCTFSIYYSTDHEEIKDKTRMYAFIFLALVALSFMLNIGQHYSFAAMGECLTKRIRERMLAKILTFEIGWFDHDDNSTGNICSQLAKDANIVSTVLRKILCATL
jgi:ATP-binding cassette subfamily B (MDR/TAP) protein 1